MNVEEAIKKRQSVRKYIDKAVEKEKLQKCLESARLAPSACNAQPWTYIVVDEQEKVKTVAEACKAQVLGMNKFADQVPAYVVIVMEKANFTSRVGTAVKGREFPLMDIGISAQNFCLQATELGLGTCMIGWFDDKKIKSALQIPKKKNIALVISLGYEPDDYKQRIKIRKPFEEVVKVNKY